MYIYSFIYLCVYIYSFIYICYINLYIKNNVQDVKSVSSQASDSGRKSHYIQHMYTVYCGVNATLSNCHPRDPLQRLQSGFRVPSSPAAMEEHPHATLLLSLLRDTNPIHIEVAGPSFARAAPSPFHMTAGDRGKPVNTRV